VDTMPPLDRFPAKSAVAASSVPAATSWGSALAVYLFLPIWLPLTVLLWAVSATAAAASAAYFGTQYGIQKIRATFVPAPSGVIDGPVVQHRPGRVLPARI